MILPSAGGTPDEPCPPPHHACAPSHPAHTCCAQVIGRVGGLTQLNGADIKPRERRDCELRYLQNIAAELAEVAEADAATAAAAAAGGSGGAAAAEAGAATVTAAPVAVARASATAAAATPAGASGGVCVAAVRQQHPRLAALQARYGVVRYAGGGAWGQQLRSCMLTGQ